jgi:chemotaxis protein CheZ
MPDVPVHGVDPQVMVAVMRAVLAEVEQLGALIVAARGEIAALEVADITASHIPTATDELDAIVAHTAAATNNILEVCERLDGLAVADDATADALQDATTRIYEACSFQDITGQRIAKVVATLKRIDAKVAQIIATFGDDTHAVAPHAPVAPDRLLNGPLLNGPQLPAAAMDQTGVDALLASLD